MTVWKTHFAVLIGVLGAFAMSSAVAVADPEDDRREQFCGYMRMSGYDLNASECDWVSIMARAQCIGLMDGKSAWDMMEVSRSMVGADTQDAQWTMLKTSVNVYCPILDSMLPMSP